LRFKTFLLFITLFLFGSLAISAQDKTTPTDDKKEPEVKIDLTKEQTDGLRVAESAIIVYSGLRGREGLGQIRKTTVEIGDLTTFSSDGKATKSEYESRILRGENLEKEKIRFDQKFPNTEYALIYDEAKIFGLFNNNTFFSPREDASKSFSDYIWHGLEALLRYKENGAKVEMEPNETIMGVDFYVVNVTDKENRKTTFYASKKTLRVMMLKYESEGVKYRRKFYDHNYAQGTLVPYRSVLWANDKQVEEREIATITFGQTVEEGLFKRPLTP
jgi:hypothetical protein